MQLLSSTEVCRLTGATYRMVDYWCRTGAIKPLVDAHGSGSARRFDVERLPAIKAVQRLAGLGAETVVLQRVTTFLEELGAFTGQLFVDADGTCWHNDMIGDAAWVLDLDVLAGREKGPPQRGDEHLAFDGWNPPSSEQSAPTSAQSQ